jgi:hypothetical protein
MNDPLTALRAYDACERTATPNALLVPSTNAAFDWISDSACGEGSAVVGHAGLPGMQTPAALLARLQREPTSLPGRVIIFTDQLVSARDATIEVRRDGNTLFLSPLELILNNQFEYTLYAVNGADHPCLMKDSSIEAVLTFTLAHLDAAQAMGSDWLARDQQELRLPKRRRDQRRRHVRTMQSSILGMLATHHDAWAQSVETKLGLLDGMYAAG